MPLAPLEKRMLPRLAPKALVVDVPGGNDLKAPKIELAVEGPELVVAKVGGEEFGRETGVVVDAKGGPVGRPGDDAGVAIAIAIAIAIAVRSSVVFHEIKELVREGVRLGMDLGLREPGGQGCGGGRTRAGRRADFLGGKRRCSRGDTFVGASGIGRPVCFGGRYGVLVVVRDEGLFRGIILRDVERER